MSTLRAQAEQIYRRFRAFPGSQHMASSFAIEVLLRELSRRRPSRVLEVGAGIGTTTYAILDAQGTAKPTLVTTEDHPFCLEQLKKNLVGMHDQYELVATVEAVRAENGFELVLLDGGKVDIDLAPLLAKRATIMVEGARDAQRATLEQSLSSVDWICSDVRTARRLPEDLERLHETPYAGGCSLYFVGPNGFDRWTCWRQRVSTALAYRVRRYRV